MCLFDVIIQFNVAFERDGVVIIDRRVIMRHYLKGTFLIDLVSSIPWDRLETFSYTFVYVHCVTIVIRLSRLRRMDALETQVEKLQYRIDNKLVWLFMNVLKLFSVLILLAHWFACIWFHIGVLGENSTDDWFTTATFDRSSFWASYVTSLYFIITTMITVGYGDVHAVSETEKVYAMCVMMVAWMVLLVIAGVLTSTIVRYDEQGAKFSEMMNRSMKYMIKNHLDSQLQSFVRTFLLQQIEHEATEEVHNELMTHLESSTRMKSEVYVGLWGKHLKRYGWFARFPPHLLGNVCSGCEMIRYSPGDVVVRPGNIGDGMYFVIKGRISETASVPSSKSVGRLSLSSLEEAKGELVPGDYFGQKSLFVPMKWTSEVKCITYCELLFLPKEKLEGWMDENEEYMQLMRNQRAIVALLCSELNIFYECLSTGVDPNYCDSESNHILHASIQLRQFDAVQKLLWKGASTSILDPRSNKYPLQLALASGDRFLIDVVAEYQDMSKFAEGDPPPIADIVQADRTAQTLVLFAAACGGFHKVMGYILDKCKTPSHFAVNDIFCCPSNPIEGRPPLGQRYNGFSLADLAAQSGHTDVIDALCDHQADFNASVNERPKLPLHYAVEAGQRDAVSHLVKHGALIILKDQNGMTPLDLAYKLETGERDTERLNIRRAITLMLRGLNLHDLSKDGKMDELKSAIADKCDPNIIHPKTGRTPLQYAADANQVAVIRELLANAADVDFTGVSQVTALYAALMKGHLDASQALLEGGSDPNKALSNGSTPLMAAIKKGSIQLVDVLLKFGAKPVLDDVKTAFEKKDKALVMKMRNSLENVGMWSPYLQGESMFHQFCRKGDVAIVNLAIEFGADILRPNSECLSPLDIAAAAGKDKVVDALVKVGKTFMGVVEMRDWLGRAIISAVKVLKGTLPVIKLLLAVGADASYPHALSEALKAGNIESSKTLIESGSDVHSLTSESVMALVVGGFTELIQVILDCACTDDPTKVRVRDEWHIYQAAQKAKELGKTDIMSFLCSKFDIDPAMLNSPLYAVQPQDLRHKSSGLIHDLEAGITAKNSSMESSGSLLTKQATRSSGISRIINQFTSRKQLPSALNDSEIPLKNSGTLSTHVTKSLSSLFSRSKRHD
jgi:ankyrin repeat protein